MLDLEGNQHAVVYSRQHRVKIITQISPLSLAMCDHLDLALAWWVTTFIKEIIAACYGSTVLLSEVDIIQFKRRYYLTLCWALLLYLTTYDRININ